MFCRMMYGYLSDNIFPLCATYLFGDTISVLYIIAFYRYCSDKAHARKIIALVTFMLVLITLYAALGVGGVTHQSTDQVAQVMGFVGIAMSIILYVSPLEMIQHVLATKSAASIPILLCIVGTVSNALWTVYGAAIGDFFVLVPNGICLVLASIQVALYVVFNPNRQTFHDEADMLENGVEDFSKPSSVPSSSSHTSSDDGDDTSSSFEELRSPRGEEAK